MIMMIMNGDDVVDDYDDDNDGEQQVLGRDHIPGQDVACFIKYNLCTKNCMSDDI